MVEIFQTLNTRAKLSGDLAMFELAKKVCLLVIILIKALWHASKVIYEVDRKLH